MVHRFACHCRRQRRPDNPRCLAHPAILPGASAVHPARNASIVRLSGAARSGPEGTHPINKIVFRVERSGLEGTHPKNKNCHPEQTKTVIPSKAKIVHPEQTKTVIPEQTKIVILSKQKTVILSKQKLSS
jgi:hypothetical protein